MGLENFKAHLCKFKNASFDAMILIYLLEGTPKYSSLVRELFHKAEEGKITYYTSLILYLEVMAGVYKKGQVDEVEKTLQFFNQFQNIHYLPLDKDIADRAAKIRAHYNFKLPDAIILATAELAKAGLFITNDKEIRKKYRELSVLYLGDYT